ncbi:septum formation family protein [Microbacterium sp. ARD31]|uniref:septum formation family protein n=1 Tax=Microbacterium sp. ARD31 TaxID=2962576 RepID=UPI00288213BE|nr:septum formation family protein [Microbacterium sp. ARD31]MDT0187074.1 septum formation family protein [Microbacterium sp. ARD31]
MTRRLGTSAAIMGLLAAAFTSTAPAAGAADPLLGAPVVGQCSDMSRAELDLPSYGEPAVDCAGTHTALVTSVLTLPDGLAYDSADLTELAVGTCSDAQRQAAGASRLGVRLTAYAIGWFIPTPEQQAAGARWLRCDLVLLGGAELLPLPGTLDVGKFPYKSTVSRCLTGPDYAVTACSEKHTYRATAAIKTKARRYPSEKAWKRLGTDRCRSATTSRTYRFSWPSKVDWKVGDRALVCYTQTKK